MVTSAFSPIRSICLILLLIGIGVCCYAFKFSADKQSYLTWSNGCLYQAFDSTIEPKLKKWDIIITYDNFLRFRKTYYNGKQEYYSFNLHKFHDLNYWGTTRNGLLRFETQGQDIIVQTYNDRAGNIDSMTNILSIPAKNMEPDRLDSLRLALLQLKTP